ncbi:MAG: helix-turn-helix domain-containing protein [Paracoccaceae bacterium]|nr:MAG: helix-turn-helix domain-containing protein [Paracoccaceae bacterium]
MTEAPRPPAHVAPYVQVLGVDDAVDFLMTFGGGDLYLADRPSRRSRLAERYGPDRAAALAEAVGAVKVRVPTANVWIAHVLKSRGLSGDEIARRLHASNVSVRRWLKQRPDHGTGPAATGGDPRQMSLL